jgi:hypothetical protein
MTEGVIVAMIMAGSGVLIAIGGGLRYVISTIIDTYKRQAEATVTAKDAEIARLRDGVSQDLKALRDDMGELRQDLWSLRRERSP